MQYPTGESAQRVRLSRAENRAFESLKQQFRHLGTMLKYFCILSLLLTAVLVGLNVLLSSDEAAVVEQERQYQAQATESLIGLNENELVEGVEGRFEPGGNSIEQEPVAEAANEPAPGTAFSYMSVLASLNSASGSQSITAFGGFSLSQNSLGQLQSALDSVTMNGYNVGFIMVDLTTGQGVAYNVDQWFYGASVIKGPYIACLGAFEPSSVSGSQFLMEAAITISDNQSYESLRYAFGPEPLRTWCNEAWVSTAIADTEYPDLTTRDLAKLWLRNYSYFIGGEPNSDLIQSWFTSTLNSVIYDNLGSRYSVNTKAGWIWPDYIGDFSAANDAGIVWAYEGPYIIAIMSDSPADMRALDSLVLAIDYTHTEML